MFALAASAACTPLPDSPAARDAREFAWVRQADGTRRCLVERHGADESLTTKGTKSETCLRFLPARRWQGVWHEEEHWSFCETAGDQCARPPVYLLVWRAPSPSELRSGRERRVRIEFIGRRTKVAEERVFGWDKSHAILVERIIRAEELPSRAPG
ncbi:hypothetical protein [Sphingomonas mesophila]|uniref:hypothetical protein n=1 Tax=Sphingomonas mesophila TaxID=2303576 RepID=UPI0013C2DD1F|nr:hypothetical protein [Sphingomonas mesophila]